MKILMVLSNPFMVDPRVHKEATSLVAEGHEVRVIVWDRKQDYEASSIIDGVSVVRVHNTRLMRAAPHDLFRNPLWWKQVQSLGKKFYQQDFRFDVIHCHDLDTLQPGVWLKQKFGVPLIYDAHEIFGYMVARTMPSLIARQAFRMEKILVEQVDRIITVNEPVKHYFKNITSKPVEIVMNCKELISKEYHPSENKTFTLSYIGVLHKGRMFPEIVDIIGQMADIRFVIAGKKENLYAEVKKRSQTYDNIVFLGTIPFSEVLPQTLKSDAVLCMIDPTDKNNRIGLANKQFEAMVCGRPIICSTGTYSGEMTTQLNCGLVIEYTPTSVQKAIETLRDDQILCQTLGKNGLDAAIREYHWDVQKKKLLALYNTLT